MKFELLTLTGVKFKGEVRQVTLSTKDGIIGVRPGHEPLTTIASPGPVTVTPEHGKPQYFAAFGGLLEVTKDYVRLLADEAEPGEDMIESEIEAALSRAEDMQAKADSTHEVHKSRELAGRHAVRLEVARLHRRNRRG